jgi:hypothetical protein
MLRKKFLAVCTATTLAFGVAAAPAAQAQQEGLVNVNIGDVTVLQNVGVGVAANVAAQICGVQVNAAVIARQVVRNNQPFGVCDIGDQNAAAPVTITPLPLP